MSTGAHPFAGFDQMAAAIGIPTAEETARQEAEAVAWRADVLAELRTQTQLLVTLVNAVNGLSVRLDALEGMVPKWLPSRPPKPSR